MYGVEKVIVDRGTFILLEAQTEFLIKKELNIGLWYQSQNMHKATAVFTKSWILNWSQSPMNVARTSQA